MTQSNKENDQHPNINKHVKPFLLKRHNFGYPLFAGLKFEQWLC